MVLIFLGHRPSLFPPFSVTENDVQTFHKKNLAKPHVYKLDEFHRPNSDNTSK